MIWRWFSRSARLEAGARFRRQHSLWLRRAVAERRQYPLIPTRRTDCGGFARLRATPEGRARAELWWELALERVDPVE